MDRMLLVKDPNLINVIYEGKHIKISYYLIIVEKYLFFHYCAPLLFVFDYAS